MGNKYIEYARQFWRENSTRLFSSNETRLYFFLLDECNNQFWSDPFGCSSLRLTNNLGISRKTLCALRLKLQERGLIRYEEGANQSAVPTYSLLSIPKDRDRTGKGQKVTVNETPKVTPEETPNETPKAKETPRVTPEETPKETPEVTPNETINKTSKTVKTNKTYSSLKEKEKEKETPSALQEVETALLADNSWIASVKELAAANGLQMDGTTIGKEITTFFLFLKSQGITTKPLPDAKSHFTNWLMKRKEHINQGTRPLPASQVGVRLEDDNPNKFKNITGWKQTDQ